MTNQKIKLPYPSTAYAAIMHFKAPVAAPSVSHFQDFHAGQTFFINVNPDASDALSPPAGGRIRVRVRHVKTPRTLSCPLVVDILDQGRGSTGTRRAFLKLYDRRFSESLRQEYCIDEWSEDNEQKYIAAVKSGRIQEFLRHYRSIKEEDWNDDMVDDWDEADAEAFLFHKTERLFRDETAAYAQLHDLQGIHCPRLLAKVSLNLDSALEVEEADERTQGSATKIDADLFKVKGVLLQYIDGFSLDDLVERAPRCMWQGLVDEAIRIIHGLGQRNVVNDDVRPENFLITTSAQYIDQQDEPIVLYDDAVRNLIKSAKWSRQHGGSKRFMRSSAPRCRKRKKAYQRPYYQVFMIDFGMAWIRPKDWSDVEWAMRKDFVDEAGCVGVVMKRRLRMTGFNLRYDRKANKPYADLAKLHPDYYMENTQGRAEKMTELGVCSTGARPSQRYGPHQ